MASFNPPFRLLYAITLNPAPKESHRIGRGLFFTEK